MKACVFIDGENFRHSITSLFPDFDQAKYLPKNAKWTELFNWLANEAYPGSQRIRTYWYVVRNLDYFPYNLPSPERVSGNQEQINKVRAILEKHAPWRQDLSTLQDTSESSALTEKIVELHKRLCDYHDEMERRSQGWINVQEGIAAKHRAIEFRRAGTLKCNLFEHQLGTEKAVDVKLAVDLITLKNAYDIALIVSGDQDYVPAVEVVKDAGKQVVNVAFTTRSGDLLPGGARRLNQSTDWNISVPHAKIKEFLGL